MDLNGLQMPNNGRGGAAGGGEGASATGSRLDGGWGDGTGWAGAFGPEIGESLDMLNVLTDGFDFDGVGEVDPGDGVTW